MKNPQLNTLIDTINSLHSLKVWYSSLLEETNVTKTFDFDGIKINSLYWLTAHIANSESLLLLKALGGEGHQYNWLKDFTLGSTMDIECTIPYEEVVRVAKEIHQNSMAFLKTLDDEDLTKENKIGFNIGGIKSYKSVIIHHIRHEGIHTGHLSTLCKLNKIKTI